MKPHRGSHGATWVGMAAAGLLLVAGEPCLAGEPQPDPRTLANEAAQYEAKRPKSPLELQKFRRSSTIHVQGPAGTDGTAVLIDLNPRINEAYVLELRWNDGVETALHLQNARPDRQRLQLDPAFPVGLVVASGGDRRPCELWSDRFPKRLRDVAQGPGPWTELCGGDVLVRHRTRGSRTAREWAAEFLRSKVRGGEELTVLARKTLYADAFLERPDVEAGKSTGEPATYPGSPPPARVDAAHGDDRLASRDLGLATTAEGGLVAGKWYPAVGVPGVFVSLVTPGRVAADLREKYRVGPLDAVEREALVFLVAFDLGAYGLGFGLGTDYPGVGWAERLLPGARDESLPGPDGFADLDPIEPTGMVPPPVADRVIATFAGGFKRIHGAFHAGPLARVHSGSHYGFVEGGVVLSKLQPGLATLYALDDGTVGMKTWVREDKLPRDAPQRHPSTRPTVNRCCATAGLCPQATTSSTPIIPWLSCSRM